MEWDIEYTDEFRLWWDGLDVESQDRIFAAVRRLQHRGPILGRPFVDTIKRSRHSQMKELRPLGSNIRILFAFDPRRSAILLIGGDKSGRWVEWYAEMIPVADRLFGEHIETLRREGEIS